MKPPTAKMVMPAAIGTFKVSRELGRGAFGVVYRALDPDLDREVAIKVLNQSALDSPNAVERFLREARVVAKMHHKHIVPVFQLGEYEGKRYIASKFISGQTLLRAIPDGGMEPERAVKFVMQLLDALAYAHDLGVMHRDVKPANILLDEKEDLYLTDFGLAGLIGQAQMTRAGSKIGTPSHMAPEQCQGKIELIGHASDQYSAGVVLYELLTQHLPFEGAPMDILLYNVVNTPPPPPSEWRADLDPRLEAICLKALAKNPADRYPSCRDFAAALNNWLTSPRTVPPPKKPTRAVRPPPPPPEVEPPPVPQPRQQPASARPSSARIAAPRMEAPEAEPASSRRTFLTVTLLGGAAAIIAGGSYVAYQLATRPTAPPEKRGLRDLRDKGSK